MTHELDNLSGSILVTDLGGRILYANKVLTNEKGLTIEGLVGKSPGQLWGGRMSPRFYKNLWNTVKEKKRAFFGSAKNKGRSGGLRMEGIHIAPIMNQVGEVEFFIEIIPDHLDANNEMHFNHDFEFIIQNQQRHPEFFLGLLQNWMGGRKLGVLEDYASPAQFLEALIKEHADFNLVEDMNLIELTKKNSFYFHELYDKYQQKVFNYLLYRLGNNRVLAEDLTQETFLRAFNALPRFEYREVQYLSYLLMVAHNLLLNHYRAPKMILIDDMAKLSAHANSSAENETEMRLVWEAVRRLAPIEQEVLTMKYSKDYSVKEIAMRLEKSVNAVKLHLSRARKKLRKIFL